MPTWSLRVPCSGRRTAQSSKAAAPRSGQAPAAKKQRVVAPARTHSALPSDSDAANLILSLSAAQPKPPPPKQQQGSTAKRPPSTHAAVLLQHAQRQHALRARQPTGPVAHAPPTTDALRRPTVTTTGPVQDQQGTDSVDAHEDLAAGAQTGPTDTGQEPGAWAGPSEPGLHAGAGLQAEPEAGVQGVGSVADELTDGECELVLSLARSAQEMRRAANDAEAALTAALQVRVTCVQMRACLFVCVCVCMGSSHMRTCSPESLPLIDPAHGKRGIQKPCELCERAV